MKRRLRASAVCEAEGHLLLVRLRDPVTGAEALYPPGGGIEPGEAPAETARRETLEETGVRVHVDPELVIVDAYPFCWAGVDYDVTTHYFAASLAGAFDPVLPGVVDASYNLGAVWLPEEEALSSLAENPAIGSAVTRLRRLVKRAAWDRHPNVAGTASMLLAIHDQFRAASERLVRLVHEEPAPDLAWLGHLFVPLAQTLHHHHRAEEAMLFPLVRRRTGVAPEALVTDHEGLTKAIDAVGESLDGADLARARTALAAFDDVLVRHLDREEALVVPLLLSMDAGELWREIHAR